MYPSQTMKVLTIIKNPIKLNTYITHNKDTGNLDNEFGPKLHCNFLKTHFSMKHFKFIYFRN